MNASSLQENHSPLPELKAITDNTEAEVTPKIMEWFLNNRMKSCLIEIKVKGEKPKPHQMATLIKVAQGKFAYKFPDGRSRTPGDAVILINASAYVVTYNPVTRMCDAQQVMGSYHYEFKI